MSSHSQIQSYCYLIKKKEHVPVCEREQTHNVNAGRSQRSVSAVFFNYFLNCLLKQDLSRNSELTDWSGLPAGELLDLLPLSLEFWAHTAVSCCSCMGAGDPNSGPHSCVSGSWLTDAPPPHCSCLYVSFIPGSMLLLYAYCDSLLFFLKSNAYAH